MRQRSLFDPDRRPNAAPQASIANRDNAADAPARIYTVSEFTEEFRFLVEATYPGVWIEGEISNFSQPASGHYYFSLKDNEAAIRAVMWKSSHRFLKWRPRNGMKVIVNGRITVYGPRGEYQVDVTQIVPHGKGDLFAAFEQLKQKLQAEGLFDTKRKKPLPLLPSRIGIVTSPTGAALRDMLNILDRRYANLHIVLFPAQVQGEEAAPSIVEGIRVLNHFQDIDVLIVGRGGGSIEDLWPFNEEIVARAIAASRIPVISGVGHETDTTIADFAADVRAPTPSAAAEIVVGKKSEFVERLNNLHGKLKATLQAKVLHLKHTTNLLSQHRALAGIPHMVRMQQQTVDDLEVRLGGGLGRFHKIQTRRLLLARHGLSPGQLRHLIELKRSGITELLSRMKTVLSARIGSAQRHVAHCDGKLNSLNPLAVLERGYSIVRSGDGTIIKSGRQTSSGARIQVRLHQGTLHCEVKEIEDE